MENLSGKSLDELRTSQEIAAGRADLKPPTVNIGQNRPPARSSQGTLLPGEWLGNRLGALANQMTAGAVATPREDIIARKYFHDLSGALDAQDWNTLTDARAELTRIRTEAEAHSPGEVKRRLDTAAHVYAKDPTEENLSLLREAKILDQRDHSLVRQYADQKTRAVMADISPLLRKIIAAAVDELAQDLQLMADHEQTVAESWGVKPVLSPLARGIELTIRTMETMARSAHTRTEDKWVDVITNGQKARVLRPVETTLDAKPFEAIPNLVELVLKYRAEGLPVPAAEELETADAIGAS